MHLQQMIWGVNFQDSRCLFKDLLKLILKKGFSNFQFSSGELHVSQVKSLICFLEYS